MTEDLVQVSREELEYLRQIKERAGSLGNRNYNLHHYAQATLRQLLADVPKNL